MSILGYLASGLGKEENVATKGLAYVLREKSTRDALAAFLQSCGASAIGDVDYVNQEGDHENGIPDLIGRLGSGALSLILEGKFWAGLTQHQPVSYLRLLPAGGALVFVVPESRVDYVWGVIRTRVVADGMTFTVKASPVTSRASTVGPDAKEILVVEWLALLRALHAAATHSKVSQLADDIKQLEGLCETVADAGFLPLRPEELTDGLWRRFEQLGLLVDDIGTQLDGLGIATRGGSRVSSLPGGTRIKLMMQGDEVELWFDSDSCHKRFPTPFWLWLPSTARPFLTAFAAKEPSVLFEVEGRPYLALPIRTGVERDEVVQDVVEGCREIARRIAPPPLPAATANGPATTATVPTAPTPDTASGRSLGDSTSLPGQGPKLG